MLAIFFSAGFVFFLLRIWQLTSNLRAARLANSDLCSQLLRSQLEGIRLNSQCLTLHNRCIEYLQELQRMKADLQARQESPTAMHKELDIQVFRDMENRVNRAKASLQGVLHAAGSEQTAIDKLLYLIDNGIPFPTD